MPAAVTQFRWDYVMESGFRALTVALALRLPGDYPLPSGELEGDLRASLFTASVSAVERAAASSRRAGP